MSNNQPYDGRHGYTVDPTFAMRTAKEPPTEPAMPPKPRPLGRHPEELQQERRAKALELAVLRANAFQDTEPAEVFICADQFLRYIETGSKP